MGININDLTTVLTLNDDLEKATGIFDRLMISTRAQLLDAVNNQEITQSEAGVIFGQAMTSVMGSSIQFLLNRDKSIAETNKIKRDTI